MLNESTLIAAVQSGDKDAFSALYEQYVKQIYTFIYYKTHHKETAEDITSLAFMKAYNNFTTFDPAKGPFSAWLYRIARNCVVDHYRAKKPVSMDIEDMWDLDIANNEDVLRDVHNRLVFEDVQKYMRELSAEQREVITMRIWGELSFKEIAEALGKSEGSCKMMFGRTIAKLREQMPLTMFIAFFLGGKLF